MEPVHTKPLKTEEQEELTNFFEKSYRPGLMQALSPSPNITLSTSLKHPKVCQVCLHGVYTFLCRDACSSHLGASKINMLYFTAHQILIIVFIIH